MGILFKYNSMISDDSILTFKIEQIGNEQNQIKVKPLQTKLCLEQLMLYSN